MPLEKLDAAKVLPDKEDGCWRWSNERYITERKNGNIVFKKSTKAVLIDSEGKPAKWNIYTKIWLSDREESGQTPTNLITDFENRHSAKELSVLGLEFDFSKPSKLVEYLISISNSNKNAIILDSFAGSGTTANAVLNLNKSDKGQRKFILVEMEEYANSLTAERAKRVINGFGKSEGNGGSFDFYTLGQPMFLEDGNLNETVGIEKIRQYVYYTETKSVFSKTQHADNKHFLGKHNDTAYYFNYEKDEVTTLDHVFLATMKTKAEQYVIYADNCLLTKDFMTKHHIIFKKIPRDITRF